MENIFVLKTFVQIPLSTLSKSFRYETQMTTFSVVSLSVLTAIIQVGQRIPECLHSGFY